MTHPDGIVARPKAHFVSERSAGNAGVALRTALRLCFAEPHGGAGHVAQGAKGEARDEVVRVHERCDQIFGELAQVRVVRGSGDKKNVSVVRLRMGRHCGDISHVRWGETIDGDAPAHGKAAGARGETGLGVSPFLRLRGTGGYVTVLCDESKTPNGSDAPSQGHPRRRPQDYDRT